MLVIIQNEKQRKKMEADLASLQPLEPASNTSRNKGHGVEK